MAGKRIATSRTDKTTRRPDSREGTGVEVVQYGVGPEVAPEIDESRMADRPAGVSEVQWRARLAYQAVQEAQAGDAAHLTRDHNFDARQAANAVLRADVDQTEPA